MTHESSTSTATPAPTIPSTTERELVVQYGALVQRVARRMLRRLPNYQITVDLDDLVSIGMMGLFEAHAKYDPEVGQRFESFAEYRVRGAMLDELRRRDFFPRRLRAKANTLRQAEEKLRVQLKRDPTPEELASALDMSVEELRRAQYETAPYTFVDRDDPSVQLRDTQPSPFARIADRQRAELLLDAIKLLPDREQLILDLYFNQEMSQRQIAGILDLTEGRISQLKTGALKKLKAHLATIMQTDADQSAARTGDARG